VTVETGVNMMDRVSDGFMSACANAREGAAEPRSIQELRNEMRTALVIEGSHIEEIRKKDLKINLRYKGHDLMSS